MRRSCFVCVLSFCLLSVGNAFAEELGLDGAKFKLENVETRFGEFKGKSGLNVTAIKQPRERGREHLAIFPDAEFGSGTIELEIVGQPLESAGRMARGFVGVAFRIQKDDPSSYEAFYLRPTNGRAEDQVRRNHSVQYISHPTHTWNKLRKESPGKYESYADLVPGEWTKVKIVVNGTDARLFVGGASQPCLIVKDLKHGDRSGNVGLWIEPSTNAWFRNVKITNSANKLSKEQIVGSWKYTSGTKDGDRVDPARFERQSVEITEKTFTLNSQTADGDAKFVMSYELDTDAKPARISLEITESPFGAGATTEGIIRFNNGKLQVCYPPMGGDVPTEFAADGGSGFFLFELEKK